MWSRPRGRDWRFPVQDSGGRRQFHLLWWQALGRISAEEHTNIFLYEPGGVICSQDHACVEAQRRIGERLYDHTVSMKACRRRLRKAWRCCGRSGRSWSGRSSIDGVGECETIDRRPRRLPSSRKSYTTSHFVGQVVRWVPSLRFRA